MPLKLPASPQDLEDLRKDMSTIDNLSGCLIMIAVAASGVAGYLIVDKIPKQKVWPIIQPLWFPLPVIIVIMAVLLFVLGKLVPQLRIKNRKARLFLAVKKYDVASAEYANWQKYGKPESLAKSYLAIIVGEGLLEGVQEYRELREKIEIAYHEQGHRVT